MSIAEGNRDDTPPWHREERLMSMPQGLARTVFETSRAAEYFTVRELQAQTGQPRERFAAVALKELVDNALDVCETAGVAPSIVIEMVMEPGLVRITVEDNGSGIPPETVRRILNFQTRTSDKAAYRSPTRGVQGNALKTVLCMPCALELREPVLIEAQGVQHRILAWVDPAGELRLECHEAAISVRPGTRITLPLPADGQECSVSFWAQAFAVFNPHASVKIRMARLGSDQAGSPPPGSSRRFLPGDRRLPRCLAQMAAERPHVRLVV
jgi:DNA topoisomerase VI subunit B